MRSVIYSIDVGREVGVGVEPIWDEIGGAFYYFNDNFYLGVAGWFLEEGVICCLSSAVVTGVAVLSKTRSWSGRD